MINNTNEAFNNPNLAPHTGRCDMMDNYSDQATPKFPEIVASASAENKVGKPFIARNTPENTKDAEDPIAAAIRFVRNSGGIGSICTANTSYYDVLHGKATVDKDGRTIPSVNTLLNKGIDPSEIELI
jgi:hypothetical protein